MQARFWLAWAIESCGRFVIFPGLKIETWGTRERRNHLETDLEQGEPTLHLETVNGRVSISR